MVMVGLALMATAAHADFVLGEYKGKLPAQASFEDAEGNKNTYDRSCDVAINLDMQSDAIDFGFSVYECGGIDNFNDTPLRFAVRGKDIFLLDENGADHPSFSDKVGTMDDAGKATVNIPWTRLENVTVYEYRDVCGQPPRIVHKSFRLQHSRGYEFQKLDENTVHFARRMSSESLYTVSKRNGFCPNQTWTDYAVGTNRSAMSGNLNK